MASVSQRRGTFKLQCTQCIDRPQYRQSQLRHTTVLTLERIVSTLFPMYVLNLSLSLSLSPNLFYGTHYNTPLERVLPFSVPVMLSLFPSLSLYGAQPYIPLEDIPPIPSASYVPSLIEQSNRSL